MADLAPKKQIRRLWLRLVTIFSWITGISFGTLLLIISLVVGATAIFVRTETFQNGLRDRVVQAVHSELGAKLTFDSAKVSIFRFEPKIDFLNLEIEHPMSKTKVSVGRASVGISLFSLPLLFFKQLRLASVEVENLSYTLVSMKKIAAALHRVRPKRAYLPSALQTSVEAIRLRNVNLSADLPLQEVYGQGLSGTLLVEHVDVGIASGEFSFSGEVALQEIRTKDYGPFNGKIALDGGTHADGITHFTGLRLHRDDHYVELSGEVKRWEDPIVELNGKAKAELSQVTSVFGLGGKVNTGFSIKGPWRTLEGSGEGTIDDFKVKNKVLSRASVKWTLKYPSLTLESLRWEKDDDKGELRGSIALRAGEESNISIKVDRAPLGSYLALATEDLRNWKGLTSGKIGFAGVLFPEPKGKFETQLTVQDWEIRTPSRDSQILAVPLVKVNTTGSVHGYDGSFNADVEAGTSRWKGEGRWTASRFDFSWKADFVGDDFGDLLGRRLRVKGALQGSLVGPWSDLVMSVDPRFNEFWVAGNKLTNLKGQLTLKDRVLAGNPLISDQVSIMGGFYFVKGPEDDEYSNLRLDIQNVEPAFLLHFAGEVPDWLKTIRGKVFLQGYLRGAIGQPMGSGSIRIDDWSFEGDRTKGRFAKGKWAVAGGELYLDSVDIRLSEEKEIITGELSLDSKGLVGLSGEGRRLKLANMLQIFDRDWNLQGLADLKFDYQRNVQTLKVASKLRDTFLGGVAQPESTVDIIWAKDQAQFSVVLFGGTAKAVGQTTESGRTRRTDAQLSFDGFNAAAFLRAFTNSRLEVPLSGSGKMSFTQPIQGSGFWAELFDVPGNFDGSIKVESAEIRRNKITLHRAQPFLVRVSGQSTLTPRWEFPDARIFSGDKVFKLAGFFQHASRFDVSADGELDIRLVAGLYPVISRSEGLARVNGRWTSQGFFGRAEILDGLVTFQGSPILIRNVQAIIKGNGAHVELQKLKGDFREGSISAAGDLTLQGADVIDGKLSIELDDTLFQPKQGISMRASGPLALRIVKGRGELSGKLSLDDASYRRRMDLKTDLLKFLRSEKLDFKPLEEEESFGREWNLNVKVVSLEPVVIRNNLADGSVALDLTVAGTIANPKLIGSVNIVHGQFYYLNHQFTVNSGSVSFGNSTANVPNYEVRAETEISEWRVFLQISGRGDDLKILYASEPALSQKDILSLILYGFKASEVPLGNEDPARSAQVSGMAFVTGKLQDRIESNLSTNLGIRRFHLVPTIDDTSKTAKRTDMQLLVGTDIIRNRLEVNYSNYLYTGGQKVEIDFKVNRNLSLVGSWARVEGQQLDDVGGVKLIFPLPESGTSRREFVNARKNAAALNPSKLN